MRVISNTFGNTQFLKTPNPPIPYPPSPKWKRIGPLGCMLAHVIGWEEFLVLIVLVTIWPMNCGDVLKPIHKVGQTQHQKHVFAHFIRHNKHIYNTKEKQRVLIGVKLFFHHQLGNMKLVSCWIGLLRNNLNTNAQSYNQFFLGEV